MQGSAIEWDQASIRSSAKNRCRALCGTDVMFIFLWTRDWWHWRSVCVNSRFVVALFIGPISHFALNKRPDLSATPATELQGGLKEA